MAHGNEKSTNTQRPSCKISLKMLWNEFVLRGGPPNMCLNCSNLGPGTFLNSGQWPQTWIFQYFCIVSGPGRWWLAIWYQLEQQTLASITNDGAGRGAKTKVDHQVHPKLCGPGFGFDIHYQNCELKILQWIPEKFSFWMCFFMWNHYFPFSFHQQLQQKYTQFWSWDFSPKIFHDSTKLGWESIQPLNTCWEKTSIDFHFTTTWTDEFQSAFQVVAFLGHGLLGAFGHRVHATFPSDISCTFANWAATCTDRRYSR